MNSAAFLLAINFSIGISFAAAFVALTWKSGVALGRWCAAGFMAASATTIVEACAAAIPSPHLTSTLSFSSLLLGLTLIVAGLARHAGKPRLVPFLLAWWTGCSVLNAEVVFYLKRGTWGQGIGYQMPLGMMLAFGCTIILPRARNHTPSLVLACVMGLGAAQFLLKTILSGLSGHGPDVRAYIGSAFAFYSQTAGSIFSILLGLALVGLIVAEMMEQSRRRFEQDSLSGVLTRGAFMAHANALLARTPAAIAVTCDLDHFKSVNDRFGHAAGDEVIQAFGRNLGSHVKDAIAGRLGGEEFCLLFASVTHDAITVRISGIRDRLRQTAYARLPSGTVVTASFGIAARQPGERLDDLLHRADMALYAAKSAGRDCYRFADAPDAVTSAGGSP